MTQLSRILGGFVANSGERAPPQQGLFILESHYYFLNSIFNRGDTIYHGTTPDTREFGQAPMLLGFFLSHLAGVILSPAICYRGQTLQL